MTSLRVLNVTLCSCLIGFTLVYTLNPTTALTTIWVPAGLAVIAGYYYHWPGVMGVGLATVATLALFNRELDNLTVGLFSLQQVLIAIVAHNYYKATNAVSEINVVANFLTPGKRRSTLIFFFTACVTALLIAIFSEHFSSDIFNSAVGLLVSNMLAVVLIVPIIVAFPVCRIAGPILVVAVIGGAATAPAWVHASAGLELVTFSVSWLLACCFAFSQKPAVASGYLAGLAFGGIMTELLWPGEFLVSERVSMLLLALFVLVIAQKMQKLRGVHQQQAQTIDKRTLRIKYLLNQRDEVTALTVHDLQSPLQSIGGLLKTLLHMTERGLSEPNQFRISLHSAIGSIDELSQRVESILSQTRPHLGGGAFYYSLENVISQVVAAHMLEIDQRHIDIQREDDASLSVKDAEEVKDILDVLLDNAIQNSPDRSVIKIVCRDIVIENTLSIDIADSGSGVAAGVIKNLFSVSTAKNSEGRQGIGLYLAYQRARSLGGTISYLSREVNGACFRLILPKPE